MHDFPHSRLSLVEAPEAPEAPEIQLRVTSVDHGSGDIGRLVLQTVMKLKFSIVFSV